jgi:hypothetical protein
MLPRWIDHPVFYGFPPGDRRRLGTGEVCGRYLIAQCWKDGIPVVLLPHPYHRGIKIISKATHTLSGVKKKAPDEGHWTLGFFLAGNGTSTAHKKVVTEKAALYGEAISQSDMWLGESGMA